MNRMVTGIVQDGLGQGRSFTQLDWVRQQFRDKVGFDPYPGTLNVRVQDTGTLVEWQACPYISIEPAPGFCAARCYRVELNDTIAGVWVVPEVPNYPIHLMEIMAPVSLREQLGVKSGDRVKIQFVEEAE